MAPSVCEFYKGKNIFITGATGFLGKVLVEKLLRSTEIETIYLLLRQKKGMTSEERLKDLCNNQLYTSLHEKRPEVFNKLKLVAGDILEDDLGISNDDKEELQKKCNIVFHSAACVRFDQKLRDAVNMNIKGTFRILKLAETMEKLEVLVHFSTAYCRCELDVLEEKVYPAHHKPAHIMNLVNWMDDELLNHLEPKLLGKEPNTYSYTKAVTEELVADYGSKFPIAIVRPSIVTAILKEPIAGWIDNINGPTGLMIGCGKGVVRSMHCVPSCLADVITVDIVANCSILVAHATAIDKPREARVYNATLSGAIRISWGEVVKLGEKWVHRYPFTVALWYPGGSPKAYRLSHQISAFFFHVIPAYFLDMMLYILGKKTFMVNVQKRISHGLEVLQHYTVKEWHFDNRNFRSLRNRISEEEDKVFYTDVSDVDPDEYMRSYILGARQYCCKEDPENIPRARKLHKIRYFADRITKLILYSLLLWLLYKYTHIFTFALESIDTTMKRFLPVNDKAENML